MIHKTRIQKFYLILFLIGFFTFFPILLIPSATSANTEYLGYYEDTMYLDSSAFSGRTHSETQTTTETISTNYGTYNNVRIRTDSTYKLSHPSEGYIEISNSKSYFDSSSILRKSESTWKLRISGYIETEIEMEHEYGSYEVLQDTQTVYEKTYTKRYYENDNFQDSTNCRDYTIFDKTEDITVGAGNYECWNYVTTYYEGGVLQGYTNSWVSESGKLIKLRQYDSSNDLIWQTTLISESKPIESWNIGLWVVSGISIVIISIVVFVKVRNKRISPYSAPKSTYRKAPRYPARAVQKANVVHRNANFCPKCGSPNLLGNFCKQCGAKINPN